MRKENVQGYLFAVGEMITIFHVRSITILLLLAGILSFAGCAHQPVPVANDLPGFFYGLFHGFTILLSFIGSIFTDIRIYAFPNSGFFYDLGFLIGAAIFLGGTGASVE
jgi:hypothetical protein